MEAGLTSYDLVSYPGYSHPQTHPDRLAVIGSLFGLDPAPSTGCRVLELACGNGSNLIPMAWSLPGSEFVGIDLAGRPISQGQNTIRDLNLANVRLVHGNISEIDGSWGQFDYIIAHGLYSWVPPAVRECILQTCRQMLSKQGIAFISYNALPGGHLRNMLRDMMLFHIRGFDSAEERVKQAMALARFIAEAQDTRDEYRMWMKAEVESILEHEEGHFYHDELAEISEPIYFTEFVKKAAAHGLQYLGEADYFEMFDRNFTESARKTLEALGRSRILREQYLDFLKCRRFRQTLLCHQETQLHVEPQPSKVAGFLVASSVKSKSNGPDFSPGAVQTYETARGAKCATDFALGKAALELLEKNWPMPMKFNDLLEQALTTVTQAGASEGDSGAPSEQLSTFLLDLYSAGMVEFRSTMPPITPHVSERPMASPVTRWQAQRGDLVVSPLHAAVKIEDEIGRCVLSSLDGTMDRPALVEKVWQLLKSKNALVLSDGDEAAAYRKIETDLQNNLEKLARIGLLVG